MSEAKIDLNNLDKSNWKTYRFDEIAKNISERVDPNNTDLEVYIGLEHIDSESLHIKRHGTPDDVNGTKLKFYKGDIIFGRRRAYQRKAGIATWDGFCSAHALVLRANTDVIDPELFPFFLHSDLFMNRAIDISVGSLSPTINWGTLKHQEFLIPAKEHQAQLAELLWSMEEVIEKELLVLDNTQKSLNSLQKKLYKNESKKKIHLRKYCTVLGGFAFPSKKFKENGTLVVKIKNIVNGSLKFDHKENHIDVDDFKNIEKFKLQPKDALIAMTGATLGKVGIVQDKIESAYLNQRVGKFIFKKSVYQDCLYGLFKSSYFLYELTKFIGVGAQGNISSEDIEKCLVPDLTENDCYEYGQMFNSLFNASKDLGSKVYLSKSLHKSLINKIF